MDKLEFTNEDKKLVDGMSMEDKSLLIGIMVQISCGERGENASISDYMQFLAHKERYNPIVGNGLAWLRNELEDFEDKAFDCIDSVIEVENNFIEWFSEVVQECMNQVDYYIIESDWRKYRKTMYKTSNLIRKGTVFAEKSKEPFGIWDNNHWYLRVAR